MEWTTDLHDSNIFFRNVGTMQLVDGNLKVINNKLNMVKKQIDEVK